MLKIEFKKIKMAYGLTGKSMAIIFTLLSSNLSIEKSYDGYTIGGTSVWYGVGA
jgi:hypothetical protein